MKIIVMLCGLLIGLLVGRVQGAISYNLLKLSTIQNNWPLLMVAILLAKGILYAGVLGATILVSIRMFIPTIVGMISVVLTLGIKRFLYGSG